MMTRKEVKKLITEVEKRQTELDSVEVKTARGGTPKRLYEALSAFANRTGGGVLLFGLDEGCIPCFLQSPPVIPKTYESREAEFGENSNMHGSITHWNY